MATARWRGSYYEIRVSCGLDSHGKRLYEYAHWKPTPEMTPKQIEKELERQKVLFEDKVRHGEIVNANIYFRDFAARWMEEYAKPRLAPKTYQRYQEYLNRINVAIGHIKLPDLRAPHLNAFYKNLAEPGVNRQGKRDKNGKLMEQKPLAPKTILDHHRLISRILNTAIRWELLDRTVAERADPPKLEYQERKCLDETELKQMLFLLNREPIQYRVMITLLLYTGMRRGELCGLERTLILRSRRSLSAVLLNTSETSNSSPRSLRLRLVSAKSPSERASANCCKITANTKRNSERRPGTSGWRQTASLLSGMEIPSTQTPSPIGSQNS